MSDYQEINLIDYLRTIKRHAGLVAGITLGVMVVAMLLRLWVVAPVGYYEGEAVLSLGTIQEKPIQPVEEVIDIVTKLTEVKAQKGGSPNILIISAKGASEKEVESQLKGVINGILKDHAYILEGEIKPINERVDERIDELKKNIIENEERLDRFQAVINRLSLTHPAQVIALSGYLASYNDTLGRIDTFKRELRELESKKLTYRETSVKKPPSLSKVSTTKFPLFIALFIGLVLGLLIGIFWAFGKDWWEVNKSLLK